MKGIEALPRSRA